MTLPISHNAAMLELTDIKFRYHENPAVLNGIDLRLDQGERVGLIGANGSGKSTLLRLIAGLAQKHGITDGAIEVNGQRLQRSRLKQIRRLLGVVFQEADSQLFMPSVFEDVAFGPQNLGLETTEIQQRVQSALNEVGLVDLESRSPMHLSGGEKRRLAIAGVLAMQPQLLLFDEPSMNLDPRGRRHLIALMRSLPQTQLITSHDLDLIWDLCPRVVVLHQGRIVADDSAESVLRDENLLESCGLELPLSLHSRGWPQDGTEAAV